MGECAEYKIILGIKKPAARGQCQAVGADHGELSSETTPDSCFFS